MVFCAYIIESITDFLELTLQFGMIMMFACAFPLIFCFAALVCDLYHKITMLFSLCVCCFDVTLLILLWTTLTTEQCYWNQSRCIEVASNVEKTCPPCCSYNWSMVEHIPGLLFEFRYLWVVGICMPWFTLTFVFSSWLWWQYAPTACFSYVCMMRRGSGGLSQD